MEEEDEEILLILPAVQDAFTIIKLVLWVPVGKGNGYFFRETFFTIMVLPTTHTMYKYQRSHFRWQSRNSLAKFRECLLNCCVSVPSSLCENLSDSMTNLVQRRASPKKI